MVSNYFVYSQNLHNYAEMEAFNTFAMHNLSTALNQESSI